MSKWRRSGSLRRGTGEGGVGRERHGTIYFQMKMDFIFQLHFFIIVKSYEADVNGALYALLCYLVLIKSGIVQDVPWPRKTSPQS